MSYIKNKHHDEIKSNHGGTRKGAGRPPEGKDGKIMSFNCNKDHIDLCNQYKAENKLSQLINHLLDKFKTNSP